MGTRRVMARRLFLRQQQHGLLFGRIDRNELHAGSCHQLEDCRGVSRIVLRSFDEDLASGIHTVDSKDVLARSMPIVVVCMWTAPLCGSFSNDHPLAH